nr:MAG TPA: hypothetical protein [Caudoviricetes sp.]
MGEIKREPPGEIRAAFLSQANSKQNSKQTCLQNSVFAFFFLE